MVLVGLLIGTVTSSMANPRMGLSAHVGTLLNGTLLVALGAAWEVVVLSPPAAALGCWLLVLGSWGGCVGLVLAALFGTHESTPIHGGAMAVARWQETLVSGMLTVPGIAVLIGTAIVFAGLRRRPPPAG